MITKEQVLGLTITKGSMPWVKIVNSTRNPSLLRIVKDAKTWWGHGGESTPELGHIKAVNQVNWSKVKKFNGVSQSNIKTIINVEG